MKAWGCLRVSSQDRLPVGNLFLKSEQELAFFSLGLDGLGEQRRNMRSHKEVQRRAPAR